MVSSVSRPARNGARLLAYSHATVDFYQGAVAALVPFLVFERGYDYAAAAGIVLASSLASSVVQPLFGALGDRWSMRRLIPVGIVFAGVGLSMIAVSDSVWITAAVAGVSGVGVAAYHPAGARRSREISGDDHVVMSWFSLGGTVGFAAAPLFVLATVGVWGLDATPLLVVPALTGLVAVALIGRLTGPIEQAGGLAGAGRAGRDDWRSFAMMSVAIMCRSVVFVGLGSFLVLFVHSHAGFGEATAAASLFVFYLGGAFGTAVGGYLARRWARTTVVRWSYALAVPVLAGLLLVPGPAVFVFIALASLVLYVPFSLHVTLGQDFLPRHMGTANGVTLGLAVSVGGLASPAIGALAADIGLQGALLPLIALPALACLVLSRVREPISSTEAPVGQERDAPTGTGPTHPVSVNPRSGTGTGVGSC